MWFRFDSCHLKEKRMNTLLDDKGLPNGMSINYPSVRNRAVQRCCEAWHRTYDTEIAGVRGIVSSAMRANEAFRTAMPPLTTSANIRDFIACTTYGLVTGAICHPAADRLFEAAKVAISLIRSQNAEKRLKNASRQRSKNTSKR